MMVAVCSAHCLIGVSRKKCLEGKGADNYWIVNTCSAGSVYISPRKLLHIIENLRFCL